ncbi:hypothetical protein Pla22_20560 [Rubripirellula amarantea]|uniref:Putative glutamine amidotransferase domain-containing protein n=1 Tax=Rubripirellula amarantea TaxID=2527999 RepID=A0A5C5WVX3_9BACT|nr:glutamine amidotransferase [Rubripirellula amarantea]TWT54409.1 hypothetical protein Pla22_20560 [Rubripirellula amarantea]
MTRFALEPIYGSLALAIALVVVTVAVVLLVTPPTPDKNRRRTLMTLRLVAAGVLIVACFRPALVTTDNRPADAALIVALDVSQSMTLPDGEGGVRFKTQSKAAEQLTSGIKKLDESLSLRLLTYAGESKLVGGSESGESKFASAGSDSELLQSLVADGSSTDLDQAIVAAIAAAQGQPIAGVVMMGDGTQTAPVSGSGAARGAKTLDSLGVPLWTIPIGPAASENASRDVAIDALNDSFQMFAGNQIQIDFQVRTRGLAGIDVPIRVSWMDEQGNLDEVATRQARSDRATDLLSMSIPVMAPEPGTYRLIVQADPQDGENVTTNNRQIAFVDVREGGGRVLYIEGSLRQEYAFLRRSLRRFPDLDLTARWIPEDTRSAWPVDLQDFFKPGRFDVYIIGDLDASAISTQQWTELAKSVEAGAGLVTLGGFHTYDVGGYADSPLAAVLPIEMDAARRRAFSADVDPETQIEGAVQIRLARSHPITDLGGSTPAETWQTLPPQLGANRWIGAKVAAGVDTLLQTSNEEPLMVVGGYGRGRVASIAFDSTWRWWRAGRSEAHRRFWRQVMLWLLSRDESGGDKILLQLDSRRFTGDAAPQFNASIESLGADQQDIELVAEVIASEADQEPQPIASTRIARGESSGMAISGEVPELPPGIYKLRVRTRSARNDIEAAELAFQVIDQSLELTRPMADPVFLNQLANQTVDQGGRSFSPSEIDELLETIQARRKKAETPMVNKARLGDGPRTGWPLFIIFAAALSTEWFLRRRWNLA